MNWVPDDSGTFYINEGGRLLTASGQPVPKRARREKPEEDKLVRQAFYDNTETANGLHTAPTLFVITIEFVADNLHLVETLIGFPEIVGETLFAAAVKRSKFKHVSEYLSIFSDAYGACVLSALKIASQSFLDKLMRVYTGLHLLSKLDLFGCDIGGGHSLLPAIAQDFTSLTHLGLAKNHLSSEDIRTLTAPCKVFQRGPKHLDVLNLSMNPHVTGDALKCLHCFKSLKLLDLSGNSLMKEACEKSTVFSLKLPSQKLPAWYQQRVPVCENEGWGKDVLTEWTKHDNEAPSTGDTSASRFYGRAQKKRPNRKPSVQFPIPQLILFPKSRAQTKPQNQAEKSNKEREPNESMDKLLSGYKTQMKPKTRTDFHL